MTIDRPGPDLVTLAEVAERLGEPVWRVQDWVDRGRLPVAVREGRAQRRRQWVRWADVRAFGELHYRGRERPAWLDKPDPEVG